MGIFNKFMSTQSEPGQPDNSRLLQLMEIYWKSAGKGETYKDVVLELMNGNSFLILPTHEAVQPGSDGWTTTTEKTTLGLTSLYNLDGLKVLGAFTDENALLVWAKKQCPCVSMRSQSVLELCERNGIARIVINNNLPNMFVLEKDRSANQEMSIRAQEEIQLGAPNTPLAKSIVEKLITRARNLDNIREIYQYGQTKGNSFSLVLSFELEKISENGKKAAIDVVGDAIADEKLPALLDVYFVEENDDWKGKISKIPGALIYKK